VRSTLQSPYPGSGAKPQSNREILLAGVVILFSSLSFFLTEYDRARSENTGLEAWVRDMLAGILPAPAQYRIAMPHLAHFFQLHAHLRANQSLPLIEAAAYLCALSLLYLLFRASPQVENVSPSRRLAALGLFLAAIQLPVLWIFPWGRPETLPCAAYLAAIVFLVARRSRMPFAIICLLTVLLSLGQAFLRADLVVIAGAAILLCAALAIPFPIRRAQLAILGLLSAAVGGTTQLYLEHVAYPHATYPPDVPKIQLLNNLNLFDAPFHIPEFLTALLPLIVAVLLWRRCRIPLDSSDKLVLLMCLLYLPVWITTGLMAEVRIFVPLLFLASPTIAKIWATFLLGESSEAVIPAV